MFFLNIVVEEKVDSSTKSYDFIQVNNEWVLKERVSKITQDDTTHRTINVLSPLQEKYIAQYGKDIRFILY